MQEGNLIRGPSGKATRHGRTALPLKEAVTQEQAVDHQEEEDRQEDSHPAEVEPIGEYLMEPGPT